MITKVRQASMTSRNTVAKTYKCNECRDTGWVEGENGFKKCICVEREHLQRLWQHFGVNPRDVKKLSQYEPYDDLTRKIKEKAICYIKNFDEIKNTEKNSFGLFGQPGAGKTHIIIAIGANLLSNENHVSAVYMPYLEATRELKANANDDEYYLKLSSRYCNAKVLIIDDLFKDKVRNGQLIKGAELTAADIKHILPIINYRYFNHLPTIYSSECTPEILLNLDEATAGRILEPCENYMAIFKDKKYNYRMRKFIKD